MSPSLRPRAGFSLIEVLVATSLLLVIGGAAATLLLQAFALWEHGVARTRKLAATDAFLTRFARDFAAVQPGLGFTGDLARCRFWTIEVPGGRPPQLARVEYTITTDAIFRLASGGGNGSPSETRFAPVEPATFGYALPANPAQWEMEWANPTSAPARVQLLAREAADDTFFPCVLTRATP